MNHADEIRVVISIGLLVASFLLNTSRYLTAIELCKECLFILKDRAAIIDEKRTKSFYKLIYFTMWEACSLISDNANAIKYTENILLIYRENGEKLEVCELSLKLAEMYFRQRKYPEAIQLSEKALLISREIGNRKREADCHVNLGGLYQLVGEYDKAREHFEKSLVILKEIGDRKGEATSYTNLGNVHQSIGEYKKAREYLEKSLVILKEIGDRQGEAASYTNLGNVYASVGDYKKAKERLEKSLAINKEIGDGKGEAISQGNLGNLYAFVGDYEKARELLEKSLAINREVGDRNIEATSYLHLGKVYAAVGEYEKASDYWQKSLAIGKKIGDRFVVASCYNVLGVKFYNFGKYSKANEYNQKALVLFTDIGDRAETARAYLNQGVVEHAVGNFIKAKEYFEKAIAISKEYGFWDVEASGYLNLGVLLVNQAEYERGEEYIKRALVISEAVGDAEKEFDSLKTMAHLRMEEGKILEAISYFLSVIEKSEVMRGSLRDNDQFKISFSDRNICSYRDLSALLCTTGNPTEALYVSELSNARALADLMSAQYSVENQISANPQTWAGLEGIVGKECNRTCLYVSYHFESIYLWIFKEGRVTHFQEMKGNDLIAHEGLGQQVEEFFDFRSFGVLPEEICEDRSLHGFQPESKTCEEDSHEGLRIGVESEAKKGPKMNLSLCYKLIIAPVVEFFEGHEIIIVPDRALYQIPFAALTDESGKCLTETFRIRMVPSLTTLKLINESPADYHCQTGALIVGNPDVGEVHFNGKLKNISRLQCAENEAKRIAKKLSVEPLIGKQATKQGVLQAMKSVALIHMAAHGDAERGAIALAPSFRIPNGIPQEGLYLLTMSDISKVQLRAKLVVLSCCHSARGQTKAEGAVGIARAFLGSGARSVLVALWALDDKATEQLMTHFYDHLVAGESAGESLHEAMKWMRSAGYDVNQWAPFILIGDDVTFDFGKKGVGKNDQDGSEGSPEM